MSKCIALDHNGKKCNRRVKGVYEYHGDSELYGDMSDPRVVTWVAAPLCADHCKQFRVRTKRK